MPLPAPNPFPKVRADDAGVAMKIFTDALLARLTLVDAPFNALPSGTPTGTVASVNAALSTLLGRFNKTITEVALPIVDAAGPLPNRVAWDMSLGNVGVVSVTKSCTILPPTNAVSGTHYTLILIQNSTGNFEVALDSVFKDVPSQNIGPNEVTVLELYYHAPNFYAPNDIKKIEERLDANDTSITELTVAKNDHEGRVVFLETAAKDKKIMVLSNRKPSSIVKSITLTQAALADNNIPANGWIGALGYPLRFADMQLNNIPDASVTHIVTKKDPALAVFDKKYAVHRKVISPIFTYITGEMVLKSVPTAVNGIDIIVNAAHIGSAIPSVGSTVDGVLIIEGDLVFIPNHSDVTKKGVHRRDSSKPGGYDLVTYPGGLVGTTILVADGTSFGGGAYKVTGGYGTAITFTKKDGSTTTTFGTTALWNDVIGRGAGGSPLTPGWTGGANGFPVFANACHVTSTTVEVESGYSVINLPAGTYVIGGNLHHGDFASSIVVAKFVDSATGFVSLANSQGIPAGASVDSVLGFNDSFALTEPSSIAIFIKTTTASTSIAFDNTYAALGDFNKNRRGTLFIEKVSDTPQSIDNDQEVIPAGYAPGYLGQFYLSAAVPSGPALPSGGWAAIAADYQARPQQHAIVNNNGYVESRNYFTGATGSSFARFFGFIQITVPGRYNFLVNSWENLAFFFGYVKSDPANFFTTGHAKKHTYRAPTLVERAANTRLIGQYIQNTDHSPEIGLNYDRNYGGTEPYTCKTAFELNALDIATAMDSSSRILLEPGLYPFIYDTSTYEGNNAGNMQMRWNHPTRGVEVIPAGNLFHIPSEIVATGSPLAKTLPSGYSAGEWRMPSGVNIPPHTWQG